MAVDLTSTQVDIKAVMDKETLRILISRLAFFLPSLPSYINSNQDEKKTKSSIYEPRDVLLLPSVGELN